MLPSLLVSILVLSQWWWCEAGRCLLSVCLPAKTFRANCGLSRFCWIFNRRHVVLRRATMSAPAIQLFVQCKILLWWPSNNMQAGVRPANFRPNPVCHANNRDVCSNMVLLISKLWNIEFSSTHKTSPLEISTWFATTLNKRDVCSYMVSLISKLIKLCNVEFASGSRNLSSQSK